MLVFLSAPTPLSPMATPPFKLSKFAKSSNEPQKSLELLSDQNEQHPLAAKQRALLSIFLMYPSALRSRPLFRASLNFPPSQQSLPCLLRFRLRREEGKHDGFACKYD